MTEQYWGAYCAQCNVWLRKNDHTLLHYPSPELMQADIVTDLDIPGPHLFREHLFEVVEFGKEQAVEPEALPAGAALCRVMVGQREQEAQRAMWASECA